MTPREKAFMRLHTAIQVATERIVREHKLDCDWDVSRSISPYEDEANFYVRLKDVKEKK